MMLLIGGHGSEARHQCRGDRDIGLCLLGLVATGLDRRGFGGEAWVDVFVVVVGRGLVAAMATTAGELVLREG